MKSVYSYFPVFFHPS